MIIKRQKQFGFISEIFRIKRNAQKQDSEMKSYMSSRASLTSEDIDKVSSELPKEYAKLYDIYEKIVSRSGVDYCGFWVSDIKYIALEKKKGDTKPIIIGFFESADPEIYFDFNKKAWIDEDGKQLTPGQLKKYLIDHCNEDLKVLSESDDIRYMNSIIAKLKNL